MKTLINKKILIEDEHEVYRYKLKENEKKEFTLNEKQKEVFNKVKENINKNEIYLLHGVTGSGKTNVYMKLIEEVTKQGKTAIFLVPEISLTPQIINRFTSYFNKIAVLHSKLSDSEKYDEWRKINEGKVNIVIGARSAVFAPLKNIGIIIIDEEHTSSYKQENTPQYDAIGCNMEIIEVKGYNKEVNPVITIKECDGIVAKQGEKYGVIDLKNNIIVPFQVDSIYSIENDKEELEYFMIYNGEELNILAMLIEQGIIKDPKKEEVVPDNSNTIVQNTVIQNNTNTLVNGNNININNIDNTITNTILKNEV